MASHKMIAVSPEIHEILQGFKDQLQASVKTNSKYGSVMVTWNDLMEMMLDDLDAMREKIRKLEEENHNIKTGTKVSGEV